MDLNLRTKSFGAPPVWLDSTETMRFRVGGGTIDYTQVPEDDGKRVIRSGTPVRLSGAKYVPANDETGGDVVLLWQTLDVTNGDKHADLFDHGRVRAAALPVTLTAEAREALAANGITIV